MIIISCVPLFCLWPATRCGAILNAEFAFAPAQNASTFTYRGRMHKLNANFITYAFGNCVVYLQHRQSSLYFSTLTEYIFYFIFIICTFSYKVYVHMSYCLLTLDVSISLIILACIIISDTHPVIQIKRNNGRLTCLQSNCFA